MHASRRVLDATASALHAMGLCRCMVGPLPFMVGPLLRVQVAEA